MNVCASAAAIDHCSRSLPSTRLGPQVISPLLAVLLVYDWVVIAGKAILNDQPLPLLSRLNETHTSLLDC